MYHFAKSNKNTQAGRSMIEVMGYMTVGMVLIIGIAKVVTGAYSDYKISQASIQLSDFAGTIVKASAADANYSEVVNVINGLKPDGSAGQDDLEKKERLRLIPKSFRLITATNKIYNVFGGEVTVSVVSAEEGNQYKNGSQFAIQFDGLDREQCIALMTKEWINNRVVDLFSIVLNGTYYWYWPLYSPDSTNNEYELPVKMIDIAGSGEASGTSDGNGLCGDDNNILWIFN